MSTLPYYPAIDGLRAIAVLSVLLFHLNPALLPGGFVGVDIFFVISGYLISRIIYMECDADRFSFSTFYQRRIARIFPMFFLVSAAILAASSVFYLPQDFASVGAVATAAAFSATNLKLMLQGNYFAMSPDAQPMLHFWSLAVEEQFYLLFPAIAWLLHHAGFSRRSLILILAFTGVASFTSCVFLTTYRPTWAFYLLPTRAWELLAGCLLACREPNCTAPNPSPLRRFHANIGLALIALSLFFLRADWNFPGFIAAIPVLGAVMFVSGATYAPNFGTWLLSRALSVFVGQVSYSLYLWHWPVFCFVDYSMYGSSAFLRTILKIFLTTFFTLVSYYALETPMRRILAKPNRRPASYAAFFVGIASLAFIGIHVRNDNYVDGRLIAVRDGGLIFNKHISSPVVVLMGDSNGSMYGRVLRDIASDIRFKLHVASVAAGDPFPPSQLYSESVSLIEHVRPDIVIFVTEWTRPSNDDNKLDFVLSQLLENSRHVVLITQPPTLPSYATRERIRADGPQPIFENESVRRKRLSSNECVMAKANNRVHVIDTNDLFQLPSGEIRFENEQGRQLFQDLGHLSGFGSDMVRPLIENDLRQILSRQ